MMEIQITASVGKSGKNITADVVKVQDLLVKHGVPIGPLDGRCGPRTIEGIRIFQSKFLPRADGLIEPSSETLLRLNKVEFRSISPNSGRSESITRLLPRNTLGPLNPGLRCADNKFMLATFGIPRASMSKECQPVDNPSLRKRIVTAAVGPFKVTGLQPAVESLKAVMQDISAQQPEVHAALGTAGMLCCRYVRGSATSISNHSWGTAIDLTLNGLLDRRGDNMVQRGLALIAPIFNKHGWYWGASYRTEDAMHFEVSRDKLETWFPG
jgi:hypothetical protein